ncbi:uncharacterized protein LOC131856588 [Cryptomeria japonica]|uniref:uncharacterized protein LOC131856588 n=1 Tax=Cryptomeria japonica TaxID=3369 RepID=UPI0027DAAD81|nr:uncharacterized protein LOC131856588 [Cryptomeria japonica]
MSDRDIRYYNREQRRQQFQMSSVPVEETFSKVLRNGDQEVDSADLVDSKGERIFGQNSVDTMMDMMSRMLATFNQNAGGGHSQNQNHNTNGNNVSTSNNSSGNGNGRNHSSNNGGMPVGSVTRPLQPVFLPREAEPPKVEVPVADEIRASFVEYASLPQEIRNILSLDQFMNQKKRREGRYDNLYSTPRDYQQDLGKVTLAHFDGSRMVVPWVGHNLITTYAEFTNRLIERFDSKDPEVKFRELAQLKQQGSLDNYKIEFQNLSVMVNSISEKRLLVLFTKGLEEPLKG